MGPEGEGKFWGTPWESSKDSGNEGQDHPELEHPGQDGQNYPELENPVEGQDFLEDDAEHTEDDHEA